MSYCNCYINVFPIYKMENKVLIPKTNCLPKKKNDDLLKHFQLLKSNQSTECTDTLFGINGTCFKFL